MDRLPHLLMTLTTIAAQTVPIECIVVEQSVAPEVRNALPQWVQYVHMPVGADSPYRRSVTFNAAAPSASTDILVLHDNDMLVPAGYAEEILAATRSGYEAVDLKRFIFYLTPGETKCAFDLSGVRPRARAAEVIANPRGGSVAITAEAYEAIGGFDESFLGWGGEDVEFWERAETRAASTFGYLPIVHLHHPAQPEKLQGAAAQGLSRYDELASIPPDARIARLRRLRGYA